MLVVVGDGGVGKTSIIIRYTRDQFTENYEPTLEDNYTATIETSDGKKTEIEIADTAGQDDYKSLRDRYLDSGDIFLVVYSVTDQRTLSAAEDRIKEIQSMKGENIKFVLAGNKCDLTNRVIPFDDGKNLANKYHGVFLETSAKTKTNINEVFQEIAHLLNNDTKKSEGGCCRI